MHFDKGWSSISISCKIDRKLTLAAGQLIKLASIRDNRLRTRDRRLGTVADNLWECRIAELFFPDLHQKYSHFQNNSRLADQTHPLFC